MKRPDFTGLWRLNLAKSRLPGLAVSQLGMKIEHNEPDFVQAVKAQYCDGRITLARFAGNTSGEEFSNDYRDLPMRSTARWTGCELIVDSLIDTGDTRPLHFRDHWSLSEDGNELRMEHRNDDIAGQLSILERISGTNVS